jgi:hypothetical protein
MNGLPNIEKPNKTLQERGLPVGSHFEITLSDGSRIDEENISWATISDKTTVKYFGEYKVAHLCNLPVTRIEVWHEGLYASLDVPDGSRAYQSIRSDTLIIPGVKRSDRVIGRLIGLVKDGEVIEELFLNGIQYEVQGMKK